MYEESITIIQSPKLVILKENETQLLVCAFEHFREVQIARGLTLGDKFRDLEISHHLYRAFHKEQDTSLNLQQEMERYGLAEFYEELVAYYLDHKACYFVVNEEWPSRETGERRKKPKPKGEVFRSGYVLLVDAVWQNTRFFVIQMI